MELYEEVQKFKKVEKERKKLVVNPEDAPLCRSCQLQLVSAQGRGMDRSASAHYTCFRPRRTASEFASQAGTRHALRYSWTTF